MDVTSLVHLFYNNPTFSDLTMIINDEPLHLHKIILAQVQCTPLMLMVIKLFFNLKVYLVTAGHNYIPKQLQ